MATRTARTLRLATDLALPLDAVTQAIGILAKRRAGKSYLGRRFAEQLIHAGQQVIIVDPKGDWWGIKSSADGKKEGLKVVILGGEHADVPLEVSSGEIVAQLAVEERVTMLLDLSEFRKHEVATFMTAFLETLYRLKAREVFRTPVMLMIDEADAIAPQKPMKGVQERMLGAANDIVRRGGQRGIGCTLITQRSAVLNKDVLTQIQLLVTLCTIAPQDLAAINAWIDVHGTKEERDILMASLPSLPVGETWFWSPGWPTHRGLFQRSEVLEIETYDSGATPKAGEKRRAPKAAADVDLDAFREKMASTIEKAKADDPRELRRRIAELEKQVRPPGKPVPPPVAIEKLIISNKQIQALENIVGRFTALGAKLSGVALDTRSILDAFDGKQVDLAAHRRAPPVEPRATGAPPHATTTPHHSLGAGERAVLIAVAQHQLGVTREQVTILTGYKTSTRNAYIQRLATAGYVVTRNLMIDATEAGVRALGSGFERLPTGDALREFWLAKLPDGERKVLEAVINGYPGGVGREAIGAATGYKTSTRNAYVQRLATRRLVEAHGNYIRASPHLFS